MGHEYTDRYIVRQGWGKPIGEGRARAGVVRERLAANSVEMFTRKSSAGSTLRREGRRKSYYVRAIDLDDRRAKIQTCTAFS